MKNTVFKLFSLSLAVILIAVMGLGMTSCKEEKTSSNAPSMPTASISDSESDTSSKRSPNVDSYGASAIDMGYGLTNFIFRVTDKDGNDSIFRVHTDEKTVGAALQSIGLIEGENGNYGLYVKTVNGRTHDPDKGDEYYWAFYVNDKYAVKGVDQTEIVKSDEYCFKAENL